MAGANLQDDAKMILNRGMSSPMDAALHISPNLHRVAALALGTFLNFSKMAIASSDLIFAT